MVLPFPKSATTPNTNAMSSFLGTPLLHHRPPPPTTALRRQTLKMSLTPPPNPITAVTKLLWGQSLPPNLLISTARSAWTAAWHLMMSQLAPSDSTGRYTRPSSSFRLPTASAAGRQNLHLYVGLPCPWAHRTLIVHALKGLHSVVAVSVATPGADGLWEFSGGGDKANGCRTLKEVYSMRRGGYEGRATVPMLWDGDRKEVVCNESYDIIEFFNGGLNEVCGNPGLDLAPVALRKRIDQWNQVIYPAVNNGVYRCGFAQSQEAYDGAANELFTSLDKIEEHLGSNRYLCGDGPTLADVCLFTTLIRFDLVYNTLFKCTKKKLLEYQNLHAYTRDIYQIPGVAETCSFEAIMDGYYKTLFPLNPGGIRPAIPLVCRHEELTKPHGRKSLLHVHDNVDALV